MSLPRDAATYSPNHLILSKDLEVRLTYLHVHQGIRSMPIPTTSSSGVWSPPIDTPASTFTTARYATSSMQLRK
jgi:hypothetical protein